MTDYDYIIIGAGASGLMLASAMGADPFFKQYSILILDKDPKKTNDRTWCFWESPEGTFDPIVHKSWSHILFKAEDFKKRMPITPYRYKMIRGIDFYRHHFTNLKAYDNITYKNEEVLSLIEGPKGVEVRTATDTYRGSYAFSSVFEYPELKEQQDFPVLQQHFIGWFVKTDQAVFDPDTATFMDFSIPQKGNTRFMYVLPFSNTEALVEYTLFSGEVLEETEYESAIADYLENDLNLKKYEITDKERGNIPMTAYNFAGKNTERIIHIGISGGWAKASTGFTFKNTTKKVAGLIAHLKKGKAPHTFEKKSRFRLYDMLLLDILDKDNSTGAEIFKSLFKRRSPELVLKFLDEDTNLWEDLRVMAACPNRPFFKALMARIF